MEIEKGEIITLTDGKEYVCLQVIIDENNKKFLYLMSTTEPLTFNFAEETTLGDIIKMRLVGSSEEKKKLFDLLKIQVQNNLNQEQQL